MPQDPNNPITPVDESLLTWRTESIATGKRLATAMETAVAIDSGTPVTESGIYLQILCACLTGRVANSSDDIQLWATDLTKDYLTKYPLTSEVKPPIPQSL